MSIEKVDDHQFRVTWEIDFWADSYEEAAIKAWETLKEAENQASIIQVEDCNEDEPLKQFDMYDYNQSLDINGIKENLNEDSD